MYWYLSLPNRGERDFLIRIHPCILKLSGPHRHTDLSVKLIIIPACPFFQMGPRVPERAEPGSGRADRLPELPPEHDAARAADSAGAEPVQRGHQPR